MPEKRLYLLEMGLITLDPNNLTPGRGMGTLVTVPATAFLITHPQGNIVFDTGMNPSLVPDSEIAEEVVAKKPGM